MISVKEDQFIADVALVAADSVRIGVEVERERAADLAEQWLDTETMKLRAGEMTAQEVRTVKAVVTAIALGICRGNA